jgi:hypothetical protein
VSFARQRSQHLYGSFHLINKISATLADEGLIQSDATAALRGVAQGCYVADWSFHSDPDSRSAKKGD